MGNSAEGLRQRLEDDLKAALRSRDKFRVATLRMTTAAIKQREVDERTTLDDHQIIAVLDKMAKQRQEAIAQYQAGSRQDLADKEAQELQLIQSYLPAALSETELAALIDEAIAVSGAASPRDMGKVMSLLRDKVQGRADMSAVSAKVKERLAS